MKPLSDSVQEAEILLRKAVQALCDCGYSDLPRWAQESCNWANMAAEQLVKHEELPFPEGPPYSHWNAVKYVQPKIFTNKWKRQDLRMAKANRRLSKKRGRGQNVIQFG